MSKRRSKRQQTVDNSRGNGDSFVLMSDILDKLHILNYYKEFLSNHNFIPLTNGYFSYSTNIAEQFAYFQSLCSWLLKYNGHSFMEWDDFQDPNSISNNILQECKKLKFPKEFPSTKLRQGYGQEICEILDFLTNLGIKKIKYHIQQPIFHKALNDDSEQLQNEESNNVEDVSDDSLMEDIMDNDSDIQKSDDENVDHFNITQKNKNYFLTKEHHTNEDIVDIDDDNEHKTTMSVMETQISSKQWTLELETVSHLLEDGYIKGINEWVVHLKKSKHHGKALKEMWPDFKARLLTYSNKLSVYLQRIDAKENHLNREFSDLSDEYQSKYIKLQTLTAEYNENIAEIATLTNNLQEMNEKINDIKIEMENRNNTMTDMTPIRRLKEIHNQLKTELVDLDLRIGVTRQQLVHSKMKYQRQTSEFKVITS